MFLFPIKNLAWNGLKYTSAIEAYDGINIFSRSVRVRGVDITLERQMGRELGDFGISNFRYQEIKILKSENRFTDIRKSINLNSFWYQNIAVYQPHEHEGYERIHCCRGRLLLRTHTFQWPCSMFADVNLLTWIYFNRCFGLCAPTCPAWYRGRSICVPCLRVLW